MRNIDYHDSKIIEDLKSCDKSREVKALTYLQKRFYGIVNDLLNKHSLNKSYLDDILIESLLAVYKNIVNDKFRGDSKLSTYFYRIAENKIIDQLRKESKKNNIDVEEQEKNGPNVFNIYEKKELSKRVYSLLNKIRPLCKDILIFSFFYNLSNNEILGKMPGISNADSLKTQKYKCIQELKRMIKSNETFYQEILESL